MSSNWTLNLAQAKLVVGGIITVFVSVVSVGWYARGLLSDIQKSISNSNNEIGKRIVEIKNESDQNNALLRVRVDGLVKINDMTVSKINALEDRVNRTDEVLAGISANTRDIDKKVEDISYYLLNKTRR